MLRFPVCQWSILAVVKPVTHSSSLPEVGLESPVAYYITILHLWSWNCISILRPEYSFWYSFCQFDLNPTAKCFDSTDRVHSLFTIQLKATGKSLHIQSSFLYLPLQAHSFMFKPIFLSKTKQVQQVKEIILNWSRSPKLNSRDKNTGFCLEDEGIHSISLR